MQGIVQGMQEDSEGCGAIQAADAVPIGCAQAIGHREIASYGWPRTWAKQLGMAAAAVVANTGPC